MDPDTDTVVDRNTVAVVDIDRNRDMDPDKNKAGDMDTTPDMVEDTAEGNNSNNKQLSERGHRRPYREPDQDNTSHR
jgi:hypothetical protein